MLCRLEGSSQGRADSARPNTQLRVRLCKTDWGSHHVCVSCMLEIHMQDCLQEDLYSLTSASQAFSHEEGCISKLPVLDEQGRTHLWLYKVSMRLHKTSSAELLCCLYLTSAVSPVALVQDRSVGHWSCR